MLEQRYKKLPLASLITVFSLFSFAVYADDVTESINEATEAYNEGAYADAVESLNYASQLIQQLKADQLKSFFPEPLEGWKSEDASSKSMGATMFGGGVTAERQYTKGKSKININVITDSPMLQGMMMMFSNPMFASADGGKLQKIKRQKAIVKYPAGRDRGEISIIIDNRILVEIKGHNVTLEELIAYAKAIDFKKLKSEV